MRKDFILDRYGLLEARAAGADMVLLIVAALDEATLRRLVDEAQGLGLTPLVEVYSAEEARVAVEIGARLVGINNRNLHTFEVTLETTERLAPLLTPHATVASLSGMSTVADVARVVAAGARAVLVGEALVRAEQPAALIRSFKAVPVAERGGLPMSAPLVKICGVRMLRHARVAAEAGADMVGLIFAPSRRQVTPEEAREITAAAYARRPRFVGVFVDENPDTVGRLAAELRLDLVQLSGQERPDDCATLRVPYMKVVHVREGMAADGCPAHSGPLPRCDSHCARRGRDRREPLGRVRPHVRSCRCRRGRPPRRSADPAGRRPALRNSRRGDPAGPALGRRCQQRRRDRWRERRCQDRGVCKRG